MADSDRDISGTRAAPQSEKPQDEPLMMDLRNYRGWRNFLITFFFLGVAGAFGLSLNLDLAGLGLERVALAMFVALAALFVGGLIGFLFGIPRSRSQEGPADAAADGDGNGDAASRARYSENTNLEQISDWLTKILVGVTLIQFGEIAERLQGFASRVGPGFMPDLSEFADAGCNPSATLTETAGGAQAVPCVSELAIVTSATVAYILFFAILGFAFAYLWTRIRLFVILTSAQNSVMRRFAKVARNEARQEMRENVEQVTRAVALENVEEVKNAVESARMKQSRNNAQALSLVEEFLDPSRDAKDLDVEEMKRAVSSASEAIRTHIFIRTRSVRKENWEQIKPRSDGAPTVEQARKARAMIARCVPVFEALIAAAPDAFHRTYAQLAYALKDQTEPDYARAEENLRKAIKLREEQGATGYKLYEMVLADIIFAQHPELADAPEGDPRLAEVQNLVRVAADEYDYTEFDHLKALSAFVQPGG